MLRIAVAWLALGGSAAARDVVIPLESPTWFVQSSGGYAYRDTELGSETIGAQTLTVPEQTLRSWQLGGLATVNLAHGLGGRLRVDGGSTSASFGALDAESSSVDGRAELFLRDPTLGQFGVGYGYGAILTEPPSAITGGSVHELPAFASLYMPDLGGGAVDWNVSFVYSWFALDTATGTTNQWSYDVRARSVWYVNRFLAIDGGLRYLRAIQFQPFDLLEGGLGLELLVPGGERHYGTVALGGSFGRIEHVELPPPFSELSRLSWEIGFTVSVHFPGVESLVELNRAYR